MPHTPAANTNITVLLLDWCARGSAGTCCCCEASSRSKARSARGPVVVRCGGTVARVVALDQSSWGSSRITSPVIRIRVEHSARTCCHGVRRNKAWSADFWFPAARAARRVSMVPVSVGRAGGPDPQVPGGCTSMAWWNGGPHAKAAASTSNFRTDTCCRCGGVFASSSDALFTSMYRGPSTTRSWWPRNYAPFSTACTMSHSMSAALRARVRHLCVLRRRGPGLGQ
jgi:hypothetical protein